jgi:hypothetical protein
MKSLSTIERRLRAIAERRGPGTALLTFANGTTRSLKVRSRQGQLELCLDAFEKLAAYPPPAPEGSLTDPPEPEPETKNNVPLQLLGAAVSCEGEPFLQFIHGLAQMIHEGRLEKSRGGCEKTLGEKKGEMK